MQSSTSSVRPSIRRTWKTFSERPPKELWPSIANTGTTRGRRNVWFCEVKSTGRGVRTLLYSDHFSFFVLFFFKKTTTLTHWEWLDVQRPKMLADRSDAGAAWFGDAGRGDAVPKSLHLIESSSKVRRANDITGKTILQAAAVQLEIPSVNIYFIHI